jgi:hypothetical protein
MGILTPSRLVFLYFIFWRDSGYCLLVLRDDLGWAEVALRCLPLFWNWPRMAEPETRTRRDMV